MRIDHAFFWTDLHKPYTDEKALDLAFDVAKDHHPRQIILGGDIADFHWYSTHDKNPDCYDAQYEVDSVLDFFLKLRNNFPNSEIIFIEGNHDARFAKYIYKNAPHLYGFINLAGLFQLDKFDIKLVPIAPDQKFSVLESGLMARHEPVSSGKNHTSITLERSFSSVIYGHLHRNATSSAVALDGREYKAISTACLCDKNSPAMQYVKNHHQWTMGFTHIIKASEKVFTMPIDIIDYQCIVSDTLYLG
jgi:predicted phosphodiesterase